MADKVYPTSVCILPLEYIYRFYMGLGRNSTYFHKLQQLIRLRNGAALCFLCGSNWSLKYYLGDFQASEAYVTLIIS